MVQATSQCFWASPKKEKVLLLCATCPEVFTILIVTSFFLMLEIGISSVAAYVYHGCLLIHLYKSVSTFFVTTHYILYMQRFEDHNKISSSPSKDLNMYLLAFLYTLLSPAPYSSWWPSAGIAPIRQWLCQQG